MDFQSDYKVCRLCLKNSAIASLFDIDGDLQYAAKVMRCVNIMISEEDGLPSSICAECAADLRVSFTFVERCEGSDKYLRCSDFNKEDTVTIDNNIKLELKQNVDDLETDEFDTNFFFDIPSEEPSECPDKSTNVLKKKKLKGKPSQCTICGLMASCPSALVVHIRKHTGERPYLCEHCHKSYIGKGSLTRHIETNHSVRERKYICETCGSSFYTKSDIIVHIRRHTGEKPHICPFCSRPFLQIASLIRHKRTHTGDKPYSCEICKKKFADKSLANKHQSVHSDEKKFSCHLCSKPMKTRNSLIAHLKLHTNPKHHVCSYCGIAFNTKGNLKKHISSVHSEKSGDCTICCKTYSNLGIHMRRHTGEKPFVCKICNTAFIAQRSLSNHMLYKHNKNNKFKCSIGECNRTFPIGSMLEFHLLKNHTNHTPYTCPHCSRGFFRYSDMSRHLRISHIDVHTKVSVKQVKADNLIS